MLYLARMLSEALIQGERVDLNRTSFPVTHNSQMSFGSRHGRDTSFLPTYTLIDGSFYPYPSIVRELFKSEKLTPLAQQYFEEKARADTAQIKVDLNVQRARKAEARVMNLEAEVIRLQVANAELEKNSILDFKERQEAELKISSLLGAIRRLRQGQPQKTIYEVLGQEDFNQHCAVLGLDPRTAFAGLTSPQKQAVLDGAYHTRSKIFHPDHGGSIKDMKKVNVAYDALKDLIK